ncbi:MULTISPECIES: M24 family metallopeptidase [Mycobacteriaceae]|uniref:Xaa-Pro peptidase family protein n=1 Tax=Mycolicibacterium parafortuitum TaxID=39692 RepID=A0ACC6MN64_MYCPF|nr:MULTISPECIES: Xaa-Pro peptidase family protein [Mycobacteriaceae]MDZ5088376.1 Xaa-Pro peptidase family protein [Mycolicibacterium parafortuitum]GFM16092.1 dipeptidase pepE [Mycobacterium sp. PO1]GFM26383.1 dipeptidase pepE [Mycobacterium sp. PO2]
MTTSRFSSDVYAQRLAAAARATAEAGLAGLVITPGYDLRYLVGSRAQTFERLTALVVPAAGDPTMIVPRLELAAMKESAVGELGIALRDWVDGDDPYALVAAALGENTLAGESAPLAVAGESAPLAVAVTDSMPALHLLPMADTLGVVPVLATDVLRTLRMIKDAAEVEALRKAGEAIDRVHARVPQFLVPGRTEADVAADIAEAIVAEGHSEVAFIIVGSGPHGADPHHECSDRELRSGDIVVVDIGGPYEPGYNSDSTRTYSIGEPDPDIARRYAVLQRAQRAAVEAVRPGVTAEQIDAAARDVLAAEGLAEAFVHRTGHGIGLSVHEEPYIVAGNRLELQEGMAFSVEPGIYFPGEWGARIEDIVIVTADGAESVNNRPHDLVVVPAS